MRALKSAHAHINALSVTRTALLEAWRDRLDDANALVSKAMAHLRRLGGDDDADSELSAAIERQKRERIIFALQAGAGSPLPSVPEAFKVIDVARRDSRNRLSPSPDAEGRAYAPFGVDDREYQLTRAVLWEHKHSVAWCLGRIERFSDQVTAVAQFPPKRDVSAL